MPDVKQRVNDRKRERSGAGESTAESETAKRTRRGNRWAATTVQRHLHAGAAARWKEPRLKLGSYQKGDGPWICLLEDLLDAYAPVVVGPARPP